MSTAVSRLLHQVRAEIATYEREIGTLRRIEAELVGAAQDYTVLVVESVAPSLPAPVGEAGTAAAADRSADELEEAPEPEQPAQQPEEQRPAASPMTERRCRLAALLANGVSMTIDQIMAELKVSRQVAYAVARIDDFYLKDGQVALSQLGVANAKRRNSRARLTGRKIDPLPAHGVDNDTPAAICKHRGKIAALLLEKDTAVSMVEIMSKLALNGRDFRDAIDCDWFMEPRHGYFNLTIIGRSATGEA